MLINDHQLGKGIDIYQLKINLHDIHPRAIRATRNYKYKPYFKYEYSINYILCKRIC